ncbi:hypothetical protein A2V71_04285 [Candidatus Berkelbacteria bacterium RBG_13_40_8]|uniref:Prepilin-type N-terminal cleavage/methylation domain-containing protein n=1 Tax=Candidatus Berkelbacteria bacterium RBG_13_40_8 TaxID=1797467 RepID=A0A1F5DNN3_9BACT|nr:MAG: hypothetical protein A2V71_04285 [Candidatus Berkelbacteria bacterium RBG_13_40_8]
MEFNKKHNSFTLVEILVAVFIFSIVVTVGTSSMVSFLNARNKLSGAKDIQEAGRLVMEMISTEIQKPIKNGENKFTIINNADQPVILDSVGLGSSGGLKIYQKFSNGNIREKFFRLLDSNDNIIDEGNCPTGEMCYVATRTVINGTSTTDWSEATSKENLDVKKLIFNGYSSSITPLDKSPFVTIEMAVKTRNQTNPQKKDQAIFKTTVANTDFYSSRSVNVSEDKVYLVDDDVNNDLGSRGIVSFNKDLDVSSRERRNDQTLAGSAMDYFDSYFYIIDLVDHSGENDAHHAWVAKWYAPSSALTDWLRTRLESRGYDKGNGITVTEDAVYTLNGNFDDRTLCKYDLNLRNRVCKVDGKIYNADGTAYTYSDGSRLTTDGTYVYKTSRGGPGFPGWFNYEPPSIAKLDLRDPNPNNWRLIKQIKGDDYTQGVGIRYDRYSNSLWVVNNGPDFLCKYDPDLSKTTRLCKSGNIRNEAGTRTISGGYGVTSDGQYIYITQEDEEWTAKVDASSSNPNEWRLIKKITGEVNSGYDILTRDNLKFSWEYE